MGLGMVVLYVWVLVGGLKSCAGLVIGLGGNYLCLVTQWVCWIWVLTCKPGYHVKLCGTTGTKMMFWCSILLYVPLCHNCCMFCRCGFPMSACNFGCSCYCRIYFDCCMYCDTGAPLGSYSGICLERGNLGDWSLWFPVSDLGLLCLQAWCWSAC